ncbi:MAG: anion permease [Legionellaceae bacterium]|nr:anion permease [Legionellaceae bacterium]
MPIGGWMSAVLVPAALLQALQQSSMNWACVNFSVIFAAALMMWIFRLVPEYAPAIFVILATVLLGLAPQEVLLSGFSSDSFFLALSVFGIGALLIKSRLFFRLSLWLLKNLPGNKFVLQLSLFLMGLLLTPLITAQSARVSLLAPLVEDMRRTAGFRAQGLAANSLAASAFFGTILFSVVFLTGKSSNFVLYGMLPEQTQWQFGWLAWCKAASVTLLFLIVAFWILQSFFFRNREKIAVDRRAVLRELRLMGPLSAHEWAAIVSMVSLLGGLITSSWHHIPSAWLSFAIFFVLLTTGLLDKNDFKSRINWPFLFYLGAIIGIMRCVQHIGIDQWIADFLGPLADMADEHLVLYLSLMYGLSWLGGFLFGTMAAPALMFTILMPLAQQAAVSPWLLAFIILMATEAWIFPYQASYFLCYEEWGREQQSFELQRLLWQNACFSILRWLAILGSVPFWQWLGII